MSTRLAAVAVGRWHWPHDAADLRQLLAMPDVALVAVQDPIPTLPPDVRPR